MRVPRPPLRALLLLPLSCYCLPFLRTTTYLVSHPPSRIESFLRYPALLRLGQHMDPLPDVQPIRPGPAAEPGGPRPARST